MLLAYLLPPVACVLGAAIAYETADGFFSGIFWGAVWGIGGFIGGTVLSPILFSDEFKERAARIEEERRSKISPHIHALASRRRQLIKIDAYGIVDDSKWKKERFQFAANVVGDTSEAVINLIETEIENYAARRSQAEFSEDMSGHDYEHLCAEVLRSSGWNAQVTQASSDQGVDVLARKESTVVVLQCKKYSAPVGNKAVQEVAAGRVHYGADHAAVVSNAGYTRSATQLAQSCGVLLLHHDDLTDLESFIAPPKHLESV